MVNGQPKAPSKPTVWCRPLSSELRQIRQSRPDSGLDLSHVWYESLKVQVVASSLDSEETATGSIHETRRVCGLSSYTRILGDI